MEMMKTPLSSLALHLGLALGLAGGLLAETGAWGPWPDLRFVPRNPAGWSLEQLAEVWSPVRGMEEDAGGVLLRVLQGRPRSLRVGEGVGLYARNFDGSVQGLVGRGEVVDSSPATGEARVRVRSVHLTRFHQHDPWKGWSARNVWRPGHAPGELSYFVSPRNLVALPPEEWEALLEGRLYRGMSARNLLRTLGSPAARGAYDFAHGRQEQWIYQDDPRQRTYVYLDVARSRVTGFHSGS